MSGAGVQFVAPSLWQVDCPPWTVPFYCRAAWIDKCRPNLLITESTYATTIRDSKRCRERDFLKKVHETVERGGKVAGPGQRGGQGTGGGFAEHWEEKLRRPSEGRLSHLSDPNDRLARASCRVTVERLWLGADMGGSSVDVAPGHQT